MARLLFVTYHRIRLLPGGGGAYRVNPRLNLADPDQGDRAVSVGDAQIGLELGVAVKGVYRPGINPRTQTQGLGGKVYAFRCQSAVQDNPAVRLAAVAGDEDQHIPLGHIGDNLF